MDEIESLRIWLALTEAALKHEREHNAFLFGLLLGHKAPKVRPERGLLTRCASALCDLLAGPGRG